MTFLFQLLLQIVSALTPGYQHTQKEQGRGGRRGRRERETERERWRKKERESLHEIFVSTENEENLIIKLAIL